MNSWWWAAAAAIIAILELHAPGYYLIWLAVGAALTATLESLIGLSLSGQLFVFAVASGLSCLAGYFAYRNLGVFDKFAAGINQKGVSMVGTRGIVSVDLANGQGKVRLGDSVWLAEGPDLPAGTPIRVTAVRNTVVIVERLRD
jgi:membrane protein implicated in regulation of membrane protease activity